jgi:hypothetical protein
MVQGLGIRATARVFEVDPNTVLQWLVEAAEQLQAFSAYFLCNLHIKQLQLDELYAVLRDLKAGEISDAEAITRLERSPHWVWTAMDPESKLLLVMDVGMRTLAMAQRVVHHVAEMLAPACVPLCVTDGLKDYGTALLTHFGYWRQSEQRHVGVQAAELLLNRLMLLLTTGRDTPVESDFHGIPPDDAMAQGLCLRSVP